MDSTRVAKMSEKFLKIVLKIFSDESIPHDSKEKKWAHLKDKKRFEGKWNGA